MNEDHTEGAALRRGPMRVILLLCGLLLTVLAAVGAFVPVLPTTPLLLLAAACFVRSSPTFHRRLLQSRFFGPYVARWQKDRTMPRAAKRKAYGLVIVTFAISIYVVDATWLRVMLLVIGIALMTFLMWLPTSPEDEDDRPL